ncbi:GNAT family N-acetyltransferase [Methylomonas koyamae]|uniref:Uncharacterized protein n=1 Tax=Methylomonas koyamae TaxID=702114 RepID=A0A291IH96_9GAMM|nr:GNAT family N-acetyltransferase [Methylomonas koyamae]ATG89745.1 hypothetical protein MKLM6_1497 [Methylomonas koyamae]OAI24774.1 hypothetical protein A1356_14875 [Methylomonas koyamae]
MEIRFVNRIGDIERRDWNALAGRDYPFLRHEFLAALEHSGAVAPATGWQPEHALLYQAGRLVAAMPLYRKTHSWGEYVFDQTWARAYAQRGLAYYPKYLAAVPFTPCTGPRIAVAPDRPADEAVVPLLDAVLERARSDGLSSWHCLFADADLCQRLAQYGLIRRDDVQFQWFNRAYRDFDDYLAALSAGKRKMVKRERRKVGEQGIELVSLDGREVDGKQWQAFYRFYALTYLKRRSQPYLNLDFFLRLAADMPEQLRLILAMKRGQAVAAALFFVGGDTLYGRYWGCDDEYDALHFEACYYQGIAYCIANGLSRFDSGAQGEHKIARGFEPVTTSSWHWIAEPDFAAAIADFVARERLHVASYRADAAQYLPFKHNADATVGNDDSHFR